MEWVLSFGLWGALSIGITEVLRDTYHVLCHRVPILARWHNRHHTAYRRDLSLVSAEHYRQSQLYHDIVESLFLSVVMVALALMLPFLGLWLGVAYALLFLLGAVQRYQSGTIKTDFNHLPGPLTVRPSAWSVNRAYHWRHHFDDTNAYFSGVFPLVDKILGTSLSLKGKTIVITGASGTLGQALIQVLLKERAQVIALTTSTCEIPGVTVVPWQVGQEAQLMAHLQKAHILITNHGVNVYQDRSPQGIHQSYEINTFSTLRLIDLFLSTVTGPQDCATKEIWVNTSEAEISPAFSPLYELSKRALGEVVSLKRLDSPCVIRKLILGPFKSKLNPYGVMRAEGVARAIIWAAKRDFRDVVITVNPLTYMLFPLKEMLATGYYSLFSRDNSVQSGG